MEPGEPGKRIFVPDYIVVRELAERLSIRPFRLVAELMKLRIFRHADDLIGFGTAAMIGNKHGYIVERLL